MLLKDPVELALSFHLHLGTKEIDKFGSAVSDAMGRFQRCISNNTNKEYSCAWDYGPVKDVPTHHSRKQNLVHMGLYALHLKRWLEFWPMDSICFISFGHSTPSETSWRSLEDCLGLDHVDIDLMHANSFSERTNENKPNMTQKDRDRMEKFYAPYNRMLCQMVPATCSLPWVQAAALL